MKIGQFARSYGVSIDTVRYYMDLELIIPEKTGGQYDFSKECCDNMEEILWLKGADFSLAEIQRIFTLKRLTNLKNEEDREYYRNLFKNKRQGLIDRKEEIEKIITRIDLKIEELGEVGYINEMRTGIPLDMLYIFACPKCGGHMMLKKAGIDNDMIHNGELTCECGFLAVITDGIMKTDTGFKEHENIGEDIEGHFIEQTSHEFVNLLYKSGTWLKNKLNPGESGSRIILELGTGSGIFLSSIYDELSEDSVYICVDHDYKILSNIKRGIESKGGSKKIIFVCTDFLDLPIENGRLDYIMDHYGTSNYNFVKPGYLVEKLQDKVKMNGKWLGTYLNFKANSKSLMQYPVENRKYFYLENITKVFRNSRFKEIETREFGFTEKGGIYEKFFIEGDRLYDFGYYGEKVE